MIAQPPGRLLGFPLGLLSHSGCAVVAATALAWPAKDGASAFPQEGCENRRPLQYRHLAGCASGKICRMWKTSERRRGLNCVSHKMRRIDPG